MCMTQNGGYVSEKAKKLETYFKAEQTKIK